MEDCRRKTPSDKVEHKNKVDNGVLAILFVSTWAQLAHIFTKSFKPRLELLYNKLGLCDMYVRGF